MKGYKLIVAYNQEIDKKTKIRKARVREEDYAEWFAETSDGKTHG